MLNLNFYSQNRVDFDYLSNVKTPSPTASHFPIPHHTLVEATRAAFESKGLRVIQEVHGTSDHQGLKDARYFGMFQVSDGDDDDDRGLIIGSRNSHDRSLSAAFAMGSGVMVCDNLSFSGEVQVSRRHTRHIEADLPRLVTNAVALLGEHRRIQDKRIAVYQNSGLTDSEVNDTLIDALDSKVIGPTKIPRVLKQWRTPAHPEFQERTAWSLFNGFTEVMKGVRPEAIVQKTQLLHGVMDARCGLVINTVAV
jgi:hypothetical protein